MWSKDQTLLMILFLEPEERKKVLFFPLSQHYKDCLLWIISTETLSRRKKPLGCGDGWVYLGP